jgi:hypothetical protein
MRRAIKSRRRPLQQTQRSPDPQDSAQPLEHAVRIIHRVCCLAGSTALIDDIRRENRGLRTAIRRHDTPVLFDWLIDALSYQGISDQVAYGYIAQHGQATWRLIEAGLSGHSGCPKLGSYWRFHDCRFDKGSRTCAEPDHIGRCPLPRHHLRNGRLNQTAYSLYLFIRDITDGDLVGWIDGRLDAVDGPSAADRLGQMQAALVEPLRHVYGVSDKVLTMALSVMMLAAAKPRWVEVGGNMIAIDTLVHNFLHRTGILRRFQAVHAYGLGCYRPGGCADVVRAAADQIDARAFNPAFPAIFPRFIQHAVWRYCAQQGLDVCNGNRIDDKRACNNVYCRARILCDRQVITSKSRANHNNT